MIPQCVCVDDLLNEMQQSQPNVIFVSPKLKSNLSARLLDECKSLKRTIVFGDELFGRQRMVGFNTFIRNSRVKEWNVMEYEGHRPAADAPPPTIETVSRAKL